MGQRKILVVDDEEHILELIKFNLEKNGFEVYTSDDGEKCIEFLSSQEVDLVVLDLMLPGMDGLEVCKKIRRIDGLDKLPIIMLTARGEETDRILGLELGADDYLTKPFSVRELLARIKAVLRRIEDTPRIKNSKVLRVKDLEMDTEKHVVMIKGKVVDLTLKEFELLKILIENRGKVLSRNLLLDEVWGYEYFGETRTVDVHIRHLRKKIGDDESGEYIETIRGVGYKIK
ncbi:response regulator transcription factor [Alkaliphilus pronyensis]|uniref:Stage 0 sporulation protein A homolog n=1 Tax=Alkaliphilus pronyensis TaxID=1482732 RepID=A0A6I0FKC3_9FIRM|nr:response regulator transcription factor [Alkaliphilus pronyensis]KAB3538573.1 response regulator transcription factor [Alkaliphilus pronyensis]